MNNVKSRANNSKTHGLARVFAGRKYHIFKLGQSWGSCQVTICGFYPRVFVAEEHLKSPMFQHALDQYPLCKECKEAFLKVETMPTRVEND